MRILHRKMCLLMISINTKLSSKYSCPVQIRLPVRFAMRFDVVIGCSVTFEGSKESVRKQIGMAVPAKGAKIIFEAILRTFAGIDYESVEPSIKE